MSADWELAFPKELRDYIEAKCRAAHAAGYAEAKGEIAAASFCVPASATAKVKATVTATAEVQHASGRRPADKARLPRGLSAVYVEEAFQALPPPHSASPIDIARTIEKRHGFVMPSTSLHRAIQQLRGVGRLHRVEGTDTWRYESPPISGGSPSPPNGPVVHPLPRRQA
jgi:hypothetical protein